MVTEYRLSPHARVDRPDNRGKVTPVPVGVVMHMEVGKSTKYVEFRWTPAEARVLAEELLTAARLAEL